MVLEKRVGFIGAGQMAEALARGFVDKGVVKAESLRVTDISKARRELFEEMGASAHEKAAEVSLQTLAGSSWPINDISLVSNAFMQECGLCELLGIPQQQS